MKPLVAIFAHPDDEAFGPGGTLAREAKKRDVYLICVTCGEKGINSRLHTKRTLKEIRCDELKESARVLGIKKVLFLNHKDGMLSNNKYHKVAGEIQEVLENIQPDTLLTFEPLGVSGHIDHMAVSMITTYLFEHLHYIKNLWYYCISEEEAQDFGKDYFIYFPEGYAKENVDMVVPIEKTWDIKVSAMHAHKSQAHDATRVLESLSRLPKEEYFLVKTK